MICSLLVLASVQFQVDGLHPNEVWTAVAPGPSPYELDADGVWVFRGGRVVDAMTNRPIAGAKIELWTEEIDEYFGGFHQIGAAESAHDGGFIIRQREAGRHAGKMRVSAAGYSTLSAAAGEVGTEIQLYPMTPPVEVFFVDTMRRAIPNVQVTSTFTCSHDLPAYHLVSDAHGKVVLSESGWQEFIPEMRILPPGYGAIEYFSPDDFLLPQDGDPRFELVLPKSPTASIRILRRDGNPDSFRRFLVFDGSCYHVLTSDSRGMIEPPTRFGSGSIEVRPLQRQHDFGASAPAGYAAALGFPLTVRPDDHDWGESTETGTLLLQIEGDLAQVPALGLQVLHQEGWSSSRRANEESSLASIEFPAGKGFILLGGHFEQFALQTIPFELQAGQSLTIAIEAITQPAITIEWPEGSYDWWVEADVNHGWGIRRDQAMHVPAGQDLAVHFRHNRRAYVHHFSPVTDGDVLHLPAPGPRVLAPNARRDVEVLLPDGTRMNNPSIKIKASINDVEVIQESIDGQTLNFIEGPAGTVMRIWARDIKHLSSKELERLPHEGEQLPPVQIQLEQKPVLHLEGPEGWRMVGWAFELSTYHGSDRFLEISPGPLQLLLELPNRERFALDLELKPGDERTIRFGLD